MKIVYATEDADGTITITDIDTGELIIEQPTTRNNPIEYFTQDND